MDKQTTDRITICTSCTRKGEACRPGYEMMARLRKAIEAAGDSVTDAFEISGTARMTGCDLPCTVAYHATRAASYVFGDIAPEDDIYDLVDFAHQHAGTQRDWYGAARQTDTPLAAALARVPAAMMAIENCTVRVS